MADDEKRSGESLTELFAQIRQTGEQQAREDNIDRIPEYINNVDQVAKDVADLRKEVAGLELKLKLKKRRETLGALLYFLPLIIIIVATAFLAIAVGQNDLRSLSNTMSVKSSEAC